jgi:hypothetical protein
MLPLTVSSVILNFGKSEALSEQAKSVKSPVIATNSFIFLIIIHPFWCRKMRLTSRRDNLAPLTPQFAEVKYMAGFGHAFDFQ